MATLPVGEREVEVVVQDADKHLVFDTMGCDQTHDIEFGFTVVSEKTGSIRLEGSHHLVG